jgi:hypothetical protein
MWSIIDVEFMFAAHSRVSIRVRNRTKLALQTRAVVNFGDLNPHDNLARGREFAFYSAGCKWISGILPYTSRERWWSSLQGEERIEALPVTA